jgi:hypothetical protein
MMCTTWTSLGLKINWRLWWFYHLVHCSYRVGLVALHVLFTASCISSTLREVQYSTRMNSESLTVKLSVSSSLCVCMRPWCGCCCLSLLRYSWLYVLSNCILSSRVCVRSSFVVFALYVSPTYMLWMCDTVCMCGCCRLSLLRYSSPYVSHTYSYIFVHVHVLCNLTKKTHILGSLHPFALLTNS